MQHLTLDMLPQPDDTTCGPTSFHAVYGLHGDRVDRHQVIRKVTPLAAERILSEYVLRALRSI